MSGSSPLARGLRLVRWARGVPRRIIPARAGFTALVVHRPGDRRDHPRSRGVYWTTCPRARRRPGSSPLARGLLRVSISSSGDPADHPRSRGVYPYQPRGEDPRRGSSPLARGLHTPHVRDVCASGIIPARAGFTRPRFSESARSRDHPRSRGVYNSCEITLRIVLGSSPLARGLRALRI